VTEGRLIGLFTVFGAATADAIYGLVAGLGLTAVSDALFSHRIALRIGSGIFLVFLGGKMLRAPSLAGYEPKSGPPRGLGAAYLSTLLLMLANPFIIVSFLAVFAALGLHLAGIGDVAAGWLFAGIFLGSTAWWIIFSLATVPLRRRLRQGGLRLFNVGAGGLICGFGLWQFVELALGR